MNPDGQGLEQSTTTDCGVAMIEFDCVGARVPKVLPVVSGLDNDSLLFTEVGAVDVRETTGADEGRLDEGLLVDVTGLGVGLRVEEVLIVGAGVSL